MVITLENGLGHLSHAVDAPMVMIYSNIVPLGWANPVEARRCAVLYGDPRLGSVRRGHRGQRSRDAAGGSRAAGRAAARGRR